MKFTKIYFFTVGDVPSVKGTEIYANQDSDGWFWLKALVGVEGFATPFASIEEIEIYLGMSLDLHEETDREEYELNKLERQKAFIKECKDKNLTQNECLERACIFPRMSKNKIRILNKPKI